MKVQSDVPQALVTQLPISVGIFFPKEFRTHEYIETSEERGTWRIGSGESQVRAFRRVLTDLFAELRELTHPEDDSVDLILIPRISKMQFSTPKETGFGHFEAWIEYAIELRSPDGTELPTWRFTGYGQAPHERFGGIEAGLSRSLSDALRSAGAQLATGFPSHDPIKERSAAAEL